MSRPIAGIGGLCQDQNGKIIGQPYPESPFRSDSASNFYRHKIKGEKFGCTLTSVLRQFPYPEIKDTNFVPEGWIDLQIAQHYDRLYVNESWRIYHSEPDNLSARRNVLKGVSGKLAFYKWVLRHEWKNAIHRPTMFLKYLIAIPLYWTLTTIAGRKVRS